MFLQASLKLLKMCKKSRKIWRKMAKVHLNIVVIPKARIFFKLKVHISGILAQIAELLLLLVEQSRTSRHACCHAPYVTWSRTTTSCSSSSTKSPFLQGLRARLGVFWNSPAAAALRTPGRNSCAALVVVTDFLCCLVALLLCVDLGVACDKLLLCILSGSLKSEVLVEEVMDSSPMPPPPPKLLDKALATALWRSVPAPQVFFQRLEKMGMSGRTLFLYIKLRERRSRIVSRNQEEKLE